ncbi:uncharacterized protein LOC120167824 [Hibiscus syriacus]|uniref:uncharacterized protein LOC120167824 n=1 Tax=Hibiscus syriacus TaxID=106335 RepID=UPI001920FC38|nr:uncharacterized protein LOC120167824 [Hibiscus syriacus]
MPGTIQVSVLDFKGLQSSSPSSEISVKVSVGKTEYQTCDKGELTFPLTTLRDNLIITLEDAEGNEISRTGVETRLVVEKGVWDDIFSLEGGGHVHMKLQFVLSEEEHQRIQIMREAALKKKREELRNRGHGSPERSSVGNSEGSGSILLYLIFIFSLLEERWNIKRKEIKQCIKPACTDPQKLFIDVLNAPFSQGSSESLFRSGLLADESSLGIDDGDRI